MMDVLTQDDEKALNNLLEYAKRCGEEFKSRYEFNESEKGGYVKNKVTSEIHKFNTERGLKRILTKIMFNECIQNNVMINKYAAFEMIRGYKW